jgi:hypothetical protein
MCGDFQGITGKTISRQSKGWISECWVMGKRTEHYENEYIQIRGSKRGEKLEC